MIDLGFIGVGGYGLMHVEGFLPFHRSGRVRIRAMADPSAAALDAALRASGLRHVAVFQDDLRMLEETALDAVVVSAPIPFHREMTLHALRRGLHILLEKPPVPLFSELRELIAADSSARVMVAFQHIYRPLVQRMKRAVRDGGIGRPLSLSAVGLWPRTTEYYERSAWAGELFRHGQATLDGPCTNAMAHFLNTLFFLAGDSLSAFASPERVEGEVYRVRPIASYDLAALRGRFDNGLGFGAAFSHASARQLPVCIRAVGTEGSVELSENSTVFRDSRGRVSRGGDGRAHLREAFLDFVEGDTSRNLTPLSAAAPYVLATNMMFQSSGGIHSADPAFVDVHHPGTPDEIFSVPGLGEIFCDSVSRGVSLGRAGLPWGGASRAISRSDFDERLMLGALSDFTETSTTHTS